MGRACRELGWQPRDFWQATPRELLWALGGVPSVAVPSRRQFATLMQAYPDPDGSCIGSSLEERQ